MVRISAGGKNPAVQDQAVAAYCPAFEPGFFIQGGVMVREALGLHVGDVVAMPSSRLASVFSIERHAVTFRYQDDKRAFCPLRRSLAGRLVVVRRAGASV